MSCFMDQTKRFNKDTIDEYYEHPDTEQLDIFGNQTNNCPVSESNSLHAATKWPP